MIIIEDGKRFRGTTSIRLPLTRKPSQVQANAYTLPL